MIRQLGERLAMNSPIQGSAADIIKLAMVRVYKRLKRDFPDSKLILQVHDELILSVPLEDREAVKEVLREAWRRQSAFPSDWWRMSTRATAGTI